MWSEGICGNGAAILKDGVMVPVEEVVRALNHRDACMKLLKRALPQLRYASVASLDHGDLRREDMIDALVARIKKTLTA